MRSYSIPERGTWEHQMRAQGRASVADKDRVDAPTYLTQIASMNAHISRAMAAFPSFS